MVYLITDRKNNKCKIGYSGAPEKRLLQLQTGNPFQLSLEKTIPGTIEEEFRIHKIFEFYRLEGEWFELSEGIKEYFKVRTTLFCNENPISLNCQKIKILVTLPHFELRALLAILPHIKTETHDVEITAKVQQALEETSGLTYATIKSAISRIAKKNLLKKIKNNWYEVNPEIFWRGSDAARQKQFSLTYQWTIE